LLSISPLDKLIFSLCNDSDNFYTNEFGTGICIFLLHLDHGPDIDI